MTSGTYVREIPHKNHQCNNSLSTKTQPSPHKHYFYPLGRGPHPRGCDSCPLNATLVRIAATHVLTNAVEIGPMLWGPCRPSGARMIFDYLLNTSD
jgi:hypothetical protein